MVVSISINQYGLKSLLRKLDTKRIQKARKRALDRGARHLLKVVRSQSRVKSGVYKGSWSAAPRGGFTAAVESRIIFNSADAYAEFVTGNTMRTTLSGGRRRGAGDAFMRKVHREESMRVRRIMQDMIRELVT